MYQLRQLIPINNINNWCWSMQLKINWQVTVAQCNSNCSRIGIFSVYITGVRLSDFGDKVATICNCAVLYCFTIKDCVLIALPPYIYIAVGCIVRAAAIMTISLHDHWTLCCGCDYCGSKNSCYITLWGWRLDDMGPRFISHLRTFWCTESPYFTSTQYPDGVRSVGIQGPESADLCWRKLNAW